MGAAPGRTAGLGGRAVGARRGRGHLSPRVPRTHMQNIKDITSNIHFEAYRVKRLHESSSAVPNGVEDQEPGAQEM